MPIARIAAPTSSHSQALYVDCPNHELRADSSAGRCRGEQEEEEAAAAAAAEDEEERWERSLFGSMGSFAARDRVSICNGNHRLELMAGKHSAHRLGQPEI